MNGERHGEQEWLDWIERGRGWRIGANWTEPAPKRAPRKRRGVIARLIAALRGATSR